MAKKKGVKKLTILESASKGYKTFRIHLWSKKVDKLKKYNPITRTREIFSKVSK